MLIRAMLRLLFIWAPFAVTSGVSAQMQGDADARALAAEMVEALGGAETWTNARWLYTAERSHSLNHKLGIDYEGWRDLTSPQGYFSAVVPEEPFSYREAWTEAQGWRVLNDEFLAFDDRRLSLEVDFWPKEIYVMYHRFAKRDPALKLSSTGERSFSVEDAVSGAPLGTYTISPEGGPLVWSSGDTDEDVTYVYGPLADFDGIRLPAWGAQTNGSWRFNYTRAYISPSGPEFSFDPPQSEN